MCGSNKFVELVPYGGVWCDNCNAMFEVQGTCDGVNKLAIRCITKHVFSDFKKEDTADVYGTVMWKGDEKVRWLGFKDRLIVEVS
mgnify:CR=1 FL=1